MAAVKRQWLGDLGAALLSSTLALEGCSPPPPAVGDEGWGPSGEHGPRAPASAEPERAPAPRPQLIPVAERQRWDRADELAQATQVGGRGPSEHQPTGLDRTVLVNEPAAAYGELGTGTVLPPGSLVAQRHHPRGSDEIRFWYVMSRAEASAGPPWRFVVLDADLRVATGSQLAICARCHLEAPYDGLFGPPPDLTQEAP